MPKYQKKPIIIEAFQLHTDYTPDCKAPEWFEAAVKDGKATRRDNGDITICRNRYFGTAFAGDYIALIDGDLFIFAKQNFEHYYSLVGDA